MANITENLRKMKIACSLKETQTILTKAREKSGIFLGRKVACLGL